MSSSFQADSIKSLPNDVQNAFQVAKDASSKAKKS